jgi:hypothetical protein
VAQLDGPVHGLNLWYAIALTTLGADYQESGLTTTRLAIK